MNRVTHLGLGFLAGAFITAFATWRIVDSNLWRTQELLSQGQYLAEWDFQVRLLSLDDDDLRCTLARFAHSHNARYRDFEFGDPPTYGAPGLVKVISEQRDQTARLFDQLDIDEYADECVPSRKLY